MSTQQGASAPQTQKTKKTVSPVRNAIALLLFILFALVAYKEWTARAGADQAKDKIEKRLAKEEGDLPSMQEVQDLVKNAPDGPGKVDGPETAVTYTWKGIFRKYVMKASYTTGKSPALLRVSWD